MTMHSEVKRHRWLELSAAITILAAGAAPLAAQTLRQAAAPQGIPIGAAASAADYGPPDLLQNPSYANLLSGQYSMLEPGNAMKWDVTQPTQDVYNFQPGDELVAFAQAHGMRVRGHNLCWHTQLPAWLAPYAATATPAGMATLLQNHITEVVTHFKGQVFAWDVVNEAFNDPSGSAQPGLRDSIWYNQPGIGQTGAGYIEQAFRWAHAADPNALLFYNDYNIEQPGPKFDAVLAMVQDFVQRGVPINGVGFEMHVLNTYYPSADQLAQNIQALAALGIQVHITEMDVRLPVDSSGEASPPMLLTTQAQIYQTILTACLQQPYCTAFQVWGVSYNDSWIPSVFPSYGAALPFDFNYNPTPAFGAMITALETTPPALKASNLLNAASYQGRAVAPGEIVTLYDSTYGPANLAVSPSGTFPTNLGGVQVLFDGVAAPLLYAVAGQVSAIVPFEVAGKQQTVIEFQYNPGGGAAVMSNTATVPVAASAPAIFALNEAGSGPGAIQNYPDYSINSASNPVAAGGYIFVYGTGGGAIVGGATDGALAPGQGSLVTQPVTATIGGAPATVLYAGPAPGQVNGLMQVNLQVPEGLAPGPQPVAITIGTAATQSGITVAVE